MLNDKIKNECIHNELDALSIEDKMRDVRMYNGGRSLHCRTTDDRIIVL